jgi:hypothetical protein
MTREDVIKGMENIVSDMQEEIDEWRDYSDSELSHGLTCDCEWWYSTAQKLKDALALLKEQEPRVMKVGEVRNWVNSDRVTREPVFIEMRSGVCGWIIDDEVREIPGAENLTSDLYSRTWRCWTSRPTDTQRRTAMWE